MEEGNSVGWLLCPGQLGSPGHERDGGGGGEAVSHAESFGKLTEAGDRQDEEREDPVRKTECGGLEGGPTEAT